MVDKICLALVVFFYRDRRIKRAFDLSVKRKTIPKELQDYNPYEVKFVHRFVLFPPIFFDD